MVDVGIFNVEILYLVDGIFIYLKLMEFCIDFAKTGCMSFLVTFVTGNFFGSNFVLGFDWKGLWGLVNLEGFL